MSIRRLVHRSSAIIIASLGFGVCAAGPPPTGTEVGVSGGAGQRVFAQRGCGGEVIEQTHHQELNAHTYVTHRAQNGVTVEADAAVLYDLGGDAPDRNVVGLISPRVGYHGRYAGASIGPGLTLVDGAVLLLPTGNVWVGRPDIVFAWADVGTGPLSAAALPLGAGLGVSRPDLRFRLGTMASDVDSRNLGLTVHADAQVAVGQVWLGAGADVHDADTWRGQLYVAFDLSRASP